MIRKRRIRKPCIEYANIVGCVNDEHIVGFYERGLIGFHRYRLLCVRIVCEGLEATAEFIESPYICGPNFVVFTSTVYKSASFSEFFDHDSWDGEIAQVEAK